MYVQSGMEWTKRADFILVDEVALLVAFLLACSLRNGVPFPSVPNGYRVLLACLLLLDFAVAVGFGSFVDVLNRGLLKELGASAKHAGLVLLFCTMGLFFVQAGDSFSRIVVLLTSILHFLLGYGTRVLMKHLIKVVDVSNATRSMVLVTEEHNVASIVGSVSAVDDFRYTGLVLIDRDATGEVISGIPVVACMADVSDWLVREWVDEVMVWPSQYTELGAYSSEALDTVEAVISGKCEGLSNQGDAAEGSVAHLIENCMQMAIPVHVRLPVGGVGEGSFVESVGGHHVLTIAYKSATALQMIRKRLLDICGGIVGSVIALIIMCVVGPIIKHESPGPILFSQTRIGLNGKRFKMYKLRSMYMDAEERKKDLMDQNRVADGMMFKIEWDPRIIGNEVVNGERKTGIGEFIRRTSLDEFPQFFNVLMGQMSLVGTRPPTVDEWEKYQYHHRARLATKPGVTGLWQVSGRSEITDFEEVVALDMKYIQNWSPALDIKILFKTIQVVIRGSGAM